MKFKGFGSEFPWTLVKNCLTPSTIYPTYPGLVSSMNTLSRDCKGRRGQHGVMPVKRSIAIALGTIGLYFKVARRGGAPREGGKQRGWVTHISFRSLSGSL